MISWSEVVITAGQALEPDMSVTEMSVLDPDLALVHDHLEFTGAQGRASQTERKGCWCPSLFPRRS